MSSERPARPVRPLATSPHTTLRRLVAGVAREASTARRPLIAVWREPVSAVDPVALFRGAADASRFYWEDPTRGITISAVGEVSRIETSGPQRFAEASRAARAVFDQIRFGAVDGLSEPDEAAPLLVGGFGFEDEPTGDARWMRFAPLRFVLPEFALTRRHRAAWRTLAARVLPNSDPDRITDALLERADDLDRAQLSASAKPARRKGFVAVTEPSAPRYRQQVDLAVASIGRGEFEKVVLTRVCKVARRGGFDAADAVAALRSQNPRCFVFAVAVDHACFVGASATRLIARRGRRVASAAVAGSTPRGTSAEEDAFLARVLVESKKEQADHAVTRFGVQTALARVCRSLDGLEAPRVLRLEHLHHLESPFEGDLRDDVDESVLDLVARLYPTPSVAGWPGDAARAFAIRQERFARGWYTGGVGWLSNRGDGELAVALRCALLHERTALLFAGAGVVEGSTARSESAKVVLEFQTALNAVVGR